MQGVRVCVFLSMFYFQSTVVYVRSWHTGQSCAGVITCKEAVQIPR